MGGLHHSLVTNCLKGRNTFFVFNEVYLSYLSNVYRACSFFTNLDLFCIDNARIIYRKIWYLSLYWYSTFLMTSHHTHLHLSCKHWHFKCMEQHVWGMVKIMPQASHIFHFPVSIYICLYIFGFSLFYWRILWMDIQEKSLCSILLTTPYNYLYVFIIRYSYSYSFIQHSRYPQVDTELVIIITMCTVQNESWRQIQIIIITTIIITMLATIMIIIQ